MMPTPRGDAVALVRDALALRAWGVALLRGDASAGARDAVPRATPAAWRLFLRAECCALPLAARVDAARVVLPPEGEAILAAFRHASLARVLAGRAQLARIDAELASMDPPPVHPLLLLKGGVAAILGNEPADLTDIDLLPGPGDFDAVEQALVTHGYAPGIDTPLHLKLSAPGTLCIELHHSLHGARRPSAASDATAPLPGFRCLHRMANVPYLVFALEHCVDVHPHRRGHLRDACLVAAAAARCTPGELREVRHVLRGTTAAAALEGMLDFSMSLHPDGPAAAGDATPAASRDPYHMVAAMKYALVSGSASGATTEFAARLTMGPDVARAFFLRYVATVRRGSRLHPEWLARRMPRVAVALELMARFPVRLVRMTRGLVRAAVLRWQYAAHWAPAPGAASR